jgi:hypothetical protein
VSARERALTSPLGAVPYTQMHPKTADGAANAISAASSRDQVTMASHNDLKVEEGSYERAWETAGVLEVFVSGSTL